MNKLLSWSEKSINVLTVLIFVLMTVVVFLQVVLRYVFDSNIYWAEEFARYSMIWIAFLGAAIGIRYGEHTRIDFFINRLSATGKKVMEIVNKIICMIFIGVISYYSITMLGNTMNLLTPSMQIPVGIVHLILPLSGIVMIVYLLCQTIELISDTNKQGDQST